MLFIMFFKYLTSSNSQSVGRYRTRYKTYLCYVAHKSIVKKVHSKVDIYILLLPMCQCKGYAKVIAIDVATPLNCKFRGFYKRSFAYYTIKERLPKILAEAIDVLQRKDIRDEFGGDAREELKITIKEIWNLKQELQMNTTLRKIGSNTSHHEYFNEYLIMYPSTTYFTAHWLYTESYLYKRIHEIFESSKHLKCLDYFRIQKRESYATNIKAMEQLGSYFTLLLNSEDSDIKEAFLKLLKLNLWGNKADLSFGSGQVEEASDSLELLKSLEPFVLCDDSEEIWSVVCNIDLPSNIIDIVLDNVGYELFADFCVADFILTKNFATSVRMYVKVYPYYVSDVTLNDLNWMLQQMGDSSIDCIQKLALNWTKFIKDGRLIIIEDNYWITSLNYSEMQNVKPELYQTLSKAKLIIFKGDLNYRKLIGERNWDPTTPLDVAVEGFSPSALCSLRIIKCEVVCGISQRVVDTIGTIDPNWLINGNYGTIQFSSHMISV